jgi:phage/plasmid primase-like uncharacterized protein
MADAIVDFMGAIAAAGLSPPKFIVADGKIHRFASDGARGDDAGWYVFHPDGVAAGRFGCWRLGVDQKWCARSRSELSAAEKAELRRRIADDRKARDEAGAVVKAEARSRSKKIWNNLPTADPGHDYLSKKKVSVYGIRQDMDQLVVPLRDFDGTLHGLQFIDADGNKRFLAGTAKQGNFHLIGQLGGVVVIAEGYATAASVHEATGHAVAVAFGDGNLMPVSEVVRERRPNISIIIAGDCDKSGTGQEKARAAAAASGGEVSIPEEPVDWNAIDGKGIDWNDVAKDEGLDAVRAAFDAVIAAARKPVDEFVSATRDISGIPAMDKAIAKGNGSAGRRPKQADILIGLARTADLFHSPDSTGYADLEINGHRETWPIRAKGFRRWLARQFFKATGGAPSSEALQSALNVIEAKAHFDGPEWIVHVRVGGFEDRIYLDLVDEKWRAVEIDTSGWRVVDNPPVRFRRTSGMKPLPIPTTGGSIETLRSFLNVQSDADFVLAVAWVLAGLRNRGPYPVMVLSGEQGSAKSTFCATVRALIDPNTAPCGPCPARTAICSLPPITGMCLPSTMCRVSPGGFPLRSAASPQAAALRCANSTPVEAVIDADPIACALRTLMASRSEWQGTASQLLAALSEMVGERVTKSKTWPDNHSALGGKVRRAATFLRRTGIKIDFGRNGRRRTIHLAKDTLSTSPENTGNLLSPLSFPSPQSQYVNTANGLAGDGMVTAAVTGVTAVAPPAVTTNPLIMNDGDSDDGNDSKLPPKSAKGNASTDAFDGVFAAVEEPVTWESEL